jgi:ribosomal protein S18 acetylase RimI-like enzyme
MEVQIRKAKASDVETLAALSRATISVSYRPLLGDDAVDAFLAGDAVEHYLEDNLGGCSLMLADGAFVGYAVCKEDLIDLMLIDPDFQRRGLGTRLLKHCEAGLLRRFAEITLESFENNDKANSFYRKNGWAEAGRYFDSRDGVNKIIFRKTG